MHLLITLAMDTYPCIYRWSPEKRRRDLVVSTDDASTRHTYPAAPMNGVLHLPTTWKSDVSTDNAGNRLVYPHDQ